MFFRNANVTIQLTSYDLESRALLTQLLAKNYEMAKTLLDLNKFSEDACFTNPGKLNMGGSGVSLQANVPVETQHLHYFVTPILSIMASLGDQQAVALLLYAGANVNNKDYYGYSPLDYAVINGHLEIVKMLVAKGAELSQQMIDTGEVGVVVNKQLGTPYTEREAFKQIKEFLATQQATPAKNQQYKG